MIPANIVLAARPRLWSLGLEYTRLRVQVSGMTETRRPVIGCSTSTWFILSGLPELQSGECSNPENQASCCTSQASWHRSLMWFCHSMRLRRQGLASSFAAWRRYRIYVGSESSQLHQGMFRASEDHFTNRCLKSRRYTIVPGPSRRFGAHGHGERLRSTTRGGR